MIVAGIQELLARELGDRLGHGHDAEMAVKLELDNRSIPPQWTDTTDGKLAGISWLALQAAGGGASVGVSAH